MKNLEDGPLPMYLKAFIEQDRRLLENELQERILLKQTKHKEQASLKSKMKGIYEKLPFQLEENVVENGDPDESSSSKKSFEFIPMEWLIQYFSNPNRVTPIGKYSTWQFEHYVDGGLIITEFYITKKTLKLCLHFKLQNAELLSFWRDFPILAI